MYLRLTQPERGQRTTCRKLGRQLPAVSPRERALATHPALHRNALYTNAERNVDPVVRPLPTVHTPIIPEVPIRLNVPEHRFSVRGADFKRSGSSRALTVYLIVLKFALVPLSSSSLL